MHSRFDLENEAHNRSVNINVSECECEVKGNHWLNYSLSLDTNFIYKVSKHSKLRIQFSRPLFRKNLHSADMEWKKTQFDWSLLPKGSLNSQWSRFIHAFVCFYISFSMCLHFSPIYRLNWVTSNMIELIKWQCLCFSRVAKVFFISSKYWSVAFVLDADVIVWWRWVPIVYFLLLFLSNTKIPIDNESDRFACRYSSVWCTMSVLLGK